MATLSPEELLRLWAAERLPPDMAIGHMLQNLVLQQATLTTLQSALNRLRIEGQDASNARQDPPPPRKSPRRH